VWVELLPHGVHGFDYQVFHLRDYVPVDRHPAVWVRIIDNLLEPLVAELVAILEGAIVLGVLLNGIISQVNVLIVDVLQVHLELRGRRSQVALFEDVELMVLVDEDPHADVKLTIVQQERPLNVFLDDKRIVLDFIARRVTAALFLRGRRLLNRLDVIGIPRVEVTVASSFRRPVFLPTLLLRRGDLDLFVLPLAVLADQLVQGVQVAKHVDATATVQVCRFKKPQVVAIEMTLRHAVSSGGASLKIECLELGHTFTPDLCSNRRIHCIGSFGLVVKKSQELLVLGSLLISPW